MKWNSYIRIRLTWPLSNIQIFYIFSLFSLINSRKDFDKIMEIFMWIGNFFNLFSKLNGQKGKNQDLRLFWSGGKVSSHWESCLIDIPWLLLLDNASNSINCNYSSRIFHFYIKHLIFHHMKFQLSWTEKLQTSNKVPYNLLKHSQRIFPHKEFTSFSKSFTFNRNVVI